jgi:hypothetical protein
MSSGDADFPDPEELSSPPPPSPAASPRALESAALNAEPPAAPPEATDPNGSAFETFRVMPPLSLLAAFAAVTWITLHRLLLPLIASRKLTPPTLLLLIAPLALNVAACASLVALALGTIDFVRARELPFSARRLLVAALSALLLSTLAVATFLPEGHMSHQHVLVAAAALHLMVVQVAMTTLRLEGSLAGRTTSFALAATSLFALSSMLLRHLHAPWAGEGIASLHGLGEVSYLLAPMASAFVVVPWSEERADRVARRSGMVAVCVMAVMFSAAARIPDALYGHLLYSTLRLEWALDRASLGYAIPISLAVGAATAASVSRDPRHRQGGAGLWLWMSGGYNPLTPARVLLTALGVMLICRAVLSLAEKTEASAS